MATNSTPVTVRLDPEQLEPLRGWAALHGRTVASELRLAAGLILREHYADHLRTDAGRLEAQRHGLDPDEELKLAEESLSAHRARVLARPSTPSPMEARLN